MNAKQALKLVTRRNAELEDFNRRSSQEIKALNACIDSVISGEKTYCDWCNEQEECQRECKGHGCAEWWMVFDPVFPEEGDKADESIRILSAGPES